ncbi:hypothetical protein [Campylobacter devanensis]|uniref:hypothetical protein n=1 Tax=Campylobacter devanensis TaxID=3161138 RepID=UPI000A34FA63|nr:hypothetical protein [Campylobacter sp. P090]
MEICPHCGFVFENDKNYWLINRTELLVKQNKKPKKRLREKKEEAKEKAILEEEIKTMEKRRNTPDNKTVVQAVRGGTKK